MMLLSLQLGIAQEYPEGQLIETIIETQFNLTSL